MPPLLLRSFESNDLAACRELYLLNEPERFPAGFLQDFEKNIDSPDCTFVVACSEDRIVGVGGVKALPMSTSSVSLLYGIVHPSWHRRGIGSALLLGRLCILPEPDPYYRLHLSPLHASSSYYTRYGFAFTEQMRYLSQLFDIYSALLYRDEWLQCRLMLEEARVAGVQSLIDRRIRIERQHAELRLHDRPA
jgi:hypothetical protein